VGDAMLETVTPKLHECVSRLVSERRLAGAAVGVVRDQDLAWSAGFGFADIASGRRPDEHTLFRVGSITKTFTATALVQLRDEGRLGLDDPVVRHIPEFSSVRCRYGSVEDVTLRRLLTHRSGLMGEPPLRHWETLKFPTMEEILGSLARVEVVIETDSAMKYSNLAFALLGEVVTRVSGRPYVEYVQAEILDPLGMTSSTFELNDDLRPRMATGYNLSLFDEDPEPSEHPLINGETAAGQLYSTVSDLAKWIALQFRTSTGSADGATDGQAGNSDGNGRRVLSARSLEEMHRPQYLEADWSGGLCLSWMGLRRGDNVYLGHGGGIHGFITQILFNKQRRTGVIALTNSGGPGADAIAGEMLELIMAAEKDAPKPVQERRPAPTPPDWKRFLGRYASRGSVPLHVECREGVLQVFMPVPAGMPPLPAIKLKATDVPHQFMVENGRWAGELLTFRLNDNGVVSGFEASGFPYSRLVEAG
jgi:D-alanyl-D-alanine carboxypeptidase